MIYYIGKLSSDNKEVGYCEGDTETFTEWIKKKTVIQVDTETTGLDPLTNKLLCIQIGTKDTQFVFESSKENIQLVKSVLEDSKILKILHNTKFDYKFLKQASIVLSNVYDTLLMECILTAGLPNRQVGLKAIAFKYLGLTLDKEIRDSITTVGLTDQVIVYSGNDVKHLEDIRDCQLKLLEKHNLLNLANLENKAVLALGDMELNGMLLDQLKWTEIATQASKTRDSQEVKLNNLAFAHPKLKGSVSAQYNAFEEEFDYNLNWSSPSQVKNILNKIGIKIESTDERHLTKFKSKSQLVKELLEYRKQDKLTTSFGLDFLEFINPATQRIHPDYWQVVSTGRISCSRPNLLNLPRKGEEGIKMRSCFIPQKGYKYVGGDYAGFELRVIAELSQDPVWIKAFNDGKDLHSELASLVFSISITNVKNPFPIKPDVTYRDVQKTINFGLALT